VREEEEECEMLLGSGRERRGYVALDQASSVNHHWDSMHKQGGETSP